jgi:hypothetical protein
MLDIIAVYEGREGVQMRKNRKVSSVMGWLLSFQLSEPGAGDCWAVSMARVRGGAAWAAGARPGSFRAWMRASDDTRLELRNASEVGAFSSSCARLPHADTPCSREIAGVLQYHGMPS